MTTNFMFSAKRLPKDGRIVIPYRIRREMHLKTGDKIFFIYDKNKKELRIETSDNIENNRR